MFVLGEWGDWLIRVGTKFCISEVFLNFTVSVFFAILLSRKYFVVVLEEWWFGCGSKISSMIVYWTPIWVKSMSVIMIRPSGSRRGRDNEVDREWERRLDNELDWYREWLCWWWLLRWWLRDEYLYLKISLNARDWVRWRGFDREVRGRGFEFDLCLLRSIIVLLIDELIIGDLDLRSWEERWLLCITLAVWLDDDRVLFRPLLFGDVVGCIILVVNDLHVDVFLTLLCLRLLWLLVEEVGVLFSEE